MGSNSSKNATTIDDTTLEINPHNIEVSPDHKKSELSEDPRSPTLHRTPLSSPSPARSWRKIAAQANFDPRSPSLQRTPTHKLVLEKLASEAFDPRSPSIMRTPLANLTDSEEGVCPPELSSPYVAGQRVIAASVTMEEAPVATVVSEEPKIEKEAEPEQEQQSFADSAELEGARRQHKDGASLTTSLDASMQLYNSENLLKDFQQTAMQSVEIVRSEPSEEPKKDASAARKRRKNHTKRDSYASSPLKKSYSPVMTADSENSFSLKQLCNNTPPRSPLSTLSSNRMGSPIDKSKLNINLFAENLPPTIAL